MRLPVLILCAAALCGADPATVVLEDLRAADRARTDLARESAAAATEQQRLNALIAATEADAAGLARATVAAEAALAAVRARLAEDDLVASRRRLAEAGDAALARLRGLAATLPPGVMPAGDGSGWEAALRLVEAAETAAATVGVEIVSGERDGRSEAVRLLRVSGAAAWWLSIDGRQGGIASCASGVRLTAIADPAAVAAIREAILQIDGRGRAAIVPLPGVQP